MSKLSGLKKLLSGEKVSSDKRTISEWFEKTVEGSVLSVNSTDHFSQMLQDLAISFESLWGRYIYAWDIMVESLPNDRLEEVKEGFFSKYPKFYEEFVVGKLCKVIESFSKEDYEIVKLREPSKGWGYFGINEKIVGIRESELGSVEDLMLDAVGVAQDLRDDFEHIIQFFKESKNTRITIALKKLEEVYSMFCTQIYEQFIESEKDCGLLALSHFYNQATK